MDPDRNATNAETRELMTRGRSSARSRIAWSLTAGLGLAVAGCGEGTPPPDSGAKAPNQPAANPASESTDKSKAKKDPRLDMGVKELRESRKKKGDQP
jgi:hypothetical protein